MALPSAIGAEHDFSGSARRLWEKGESDLPRGLLRFCIMASVGVNAFERRGRVYSKSCGDRYSDLRRKAPVVCRRCCSTALGCAAALRRRCPRNMRP